MPSYVTPKKNTEFIFYASVVDQANTKLMKSSPTIAAGDFKVSTDGGALGNLGTLPAVTPAVSVMIKFVVSAAEMNGDNITIVGVDAVGAEWCDIVINIQTSARQVDDLAFPTTTGRSLDVTATGAAGIDWGNVENKTTVNDLSATDIQLCDTTAVLTGHTPQTGDSFARIGVAGAGLTNIDLPNQTMDITGSLSGSVGSVTGAVGSVTGAVGSVAAGGITSGSFGAGAIDAAAIATNAIDSDAIATDAIDAAAIAADAVTEIRSLVSGTADAGGSTTTMVDAARTEADDLWNLNWVLFTSGSVANQCRLITNFDAATDTMTFAPAVAASVGAGITYEILPASSVDVQSWLATNAAASLVNALVSGAVDADVSAIQNDAITAAAIANDAIGATEIANGAIDAATFAAGAIDAAAIATGAIDADALAADTITAAKIANDAIGATEIANGAIDAATFAAGAIDASAIAANAITAAKIAAAAITVTQAPTLDAAITTRATPAEVNAQVDVALGTDTQAMPGRETPTETPTLIQAILYLYKFMRNQIDNDGTTIQVYNGAVNGGNDAQ
jgi:hypothetical protein